MKWERGHPYAWRTWLRGHFPYWMIRIGAFPDKGQDCETVGGWHHWYNRDGVSSACYHCKVIRPGRLWETR